MVTFHKESRMKSAKTGWISLLAIAMLILTADGSSALAQAKLAYVDSQTIMEKSVEAQRAQKQLAEINKAWQDEASNMENQLRTMQEELEAKQLMMTEDVIKAKQAEMQNLYLQYQQFQQEKWGQQGELQKQQVKLMEPIIKKINDTIRSVGDTEGYDFIFDVASGGVVHVSDKPVDLTEKIITAVNKTGQ